MTFYAPQTARFDGSARPLTEDELFRVAPSVFATEAHESRSDRFRPIPTIDIVRGLADEGFHVVGAKQSRSRDVTRKNYTKHLLRLRPDNVVAAVGDSVVEALLVNGNDGSAAYKLFFGLFRVVCQNSLVASQASIDEVKVRHSGDVRAKVIEGTYRVLENAAQAIEAPERWAQIRVDQDEARIFAEAAHELRFDRDEDGNTHTPIKAEQLLIPRRPADTDPNLWTVFNVVQENAVKGGLSARGERRRVTTREIKGIDQDVKLNRALWTLTAKFAELKA